MPVSWNIGGRTGTQSSSGAGDGAVGMLVALSMSASRPEDRCGGASSGWTVRHPRCLRMRTIFLKQARQLKPCHNSSKWRNGRQSGPVCLLLAQAVTAGDRSGSQAVQGSVSASGRNPTCAGPARTCERSAFAWRGQGRMHRRACPW